jgi:hypothetical protein
VPQLEALLRLASGDGQSPLKDKLWLFQQLLLHGAVLSARNTLTNIVRQNIPENWHQKFAQDSKYLEAVSKIFDINSQLPVRNALLSSSNNFLRGIENSGTVFIIIPTVFNNFMISFPVLHSLLVTCGYRDFDVLFLKRNFSDFKNQNNPVEQKLAALERALAPVVLKFRDRRIVFLGASSGGFSAAYLAARLKATGAILFGSMTDLSTDSTLPMRKLRHSHSQDVGAESMRQNSNHLNLKSIPGIENLEFIDLYWGGWDEIDSAHAENLSELPNSYLNVIPNCFHLCIPKMISLGTFMPSISRRHKVKISVK